MKKEAEGKMFLWTSEAAARGRAKKGMAVQFKPTRADEQPDTAADRCATAHGGAPIPVHATRALCSLWKEGSGVEQRMSQRSAGQWTCDAPWLPPFVVLPPRASFFLVWFDNAHAWQLRLH